jgi:hypothetical protein
MPFNYWILSALLIYPDSGVCRHTLELSREASSDFPLRILFLVAGRHQSTLPDLGRTKRVSAYEGLPSYCIKEFSPILHTFHVRYISSLDRPKRGEPSASPASVQVSEDQIHSNLTNFPHAHAHIPVKWSIAVAYHCGKLSSRAFIGERNMWKDHEETLQRHLDLAV